MIAAIGLPKERLCTYCWDGKDVSCGGGCRANALAVTDAGSMRLEDAFFGEDGNQCILFQEGYVERIHRTVEEAIQKRRREQGS